MSPCVLGLLKLRLSSPLRRALNVNEAMKRNIALWAVITPVFWLVIVLSVRYELLNAVVFWISSVSVFIYYLLLIEVKPSQYQVAGQLRFVHSFVATVVTVISPFLALFLSCLAGSCPTA